MFCFRSSSLLLSFFFSFSFIFLSSLSSILSHELIDHLARIAAGKQAFSVWRLLFTRQSTRVKEPSKNKRTGVTKTLHFLQVQTQRPTKQTTTTASGTNTRLYTLQVRRCSFRSAGVSALRPSCPSCLSQLRQCQLQPVPASPAVHRPLPFSV